MITSTRISIRIDRTKITDDRCPMQSKYLFSAIITAGLFAAPAAYAVIGGSDFDPMDFAKGVQYEKTMTFEMKSGPMKVYVVKMRDKRMVVVPAEDFESYMTKSEGRSISLGQ
jgi:hypothetical protein